MLETSNLTKYYCRKNSQIVNLLKRNDQSRKEVKVKRFTYTMSSIGSQGVTIGANTPEGTRRIMTSEGTLVADFQALVHVLANLVHPRGESFVAGTLETTFDVRARSVATYVLLGQAFVVIHATSTSRVQYVSRGTFAPERAISVDTLAVSTGVWHDETLVQVDSYIVSAWPFRTQPLEFLCTKEFIKRNLIKDFFLSYIRVFHLLWLIKFLR